MRLLQKKTVVRVVVIVQLAIAGYTYYRYLYPYGMSHCCDVQLRMALLMYADAHDGWFPKGESSPEASLSLLYRENPDSVSPYVLRGKTVPVSPVLARLNAGELLTPETCDWHYVEGLRKDDDSRLALFWDKVGLGHNGQRLDLGGHYVILVNGDRRYIPDDEWEAFLTEQAQLRAELKRPPNQPVR